MTELEGDNWMHYRFYMHTVLYVKSYGRFQRMCICSFIRPIFKPLIHLSAKQIPSGTN